MEQNRLKELILSIRKSKHRLEEKVSDLALAIEDKGIIDADTHELAELIKDTFTKRRKKEVYADLLSSIIGESASLEERPTFISLSYNLGTNEMETVTFKLGDPVIYNDNSISPYMSILTVEQAGKWSVSASHDFLVDIITALTPSSSNFMSSDNYQGASVEEICEMYGVDENYARSLLLNGAYLVATYILAYITYPGVVDDLKLRHNIPADEHLYITVTYDGVDYKYDSDGKITITESSNTTPVAKEAPTFRSISNQSGNYSVSTYTLGNPIIVPEDINDPTGLIDPYMMFLTDEEAQKFNVSCETNIPDAGFEETFELFDIPSDLSQLKGNCTKGFNVFYLSLLSQAAVEYQSEIPDAYIKVTITYDGVDYVYLS